MFGIIDLTTFLIGTVIIILLPGPNSMYVMTVAARRGVWPGFQGALGVFFGDLTLILLSVGGVASLIHTTPVLFTLLKYMGAGYLIWLGIGLLRSLREPPSLDALPEQMQDRKHPFKVALIVSLLNPKAILFFVSFFIQFVDPAYDQPLISFAILGLILQVISQSYLAAVVLLAAYLKRRWSGRSRVVQLSKAGVGTLFVGYGAKLALATVS